MCCISLYKHQAAMFFLNTTIRTFFILHHIIVNALSTPCISVCAIPIVFICVGFKDFFAPAIENEYAFYKNTGGYDFKQIISSVIVRGKCIWDK